MNETWYEAKEHPPREPEPFRDIDPTFRCGSCGKQVTDILVTDTPNFLCGSCRKKWNAQCDTP